MKRIILLFAFLIAGINTALFAQRHMQDVVYLKNGSMIKGIIIEQVPNQSLKIQTADGSIFAYNIEDVSKITKENVGSYKSNRYTNHALQEYDITGYRGFVDFGYTIGTSDYDGTGRLELTTSHGYQFNPYLFVGVGTGIHYYTDGSLCAIPVFADIRANVLKGSIVPFVGIKGGYTFADIKGAYIAPSVGVKLMISSKTALNFTLGYTYQGAKLGEIYYNGYSYDLGSANIGGISLKVGVEF